MVDNFGEENEAEDPHVDEHNPEVVLQCCWVFQMNNE